MKINIEVTLRRNKAELVQVHHNSRFEDLKYCGIESGCYIFLLDDDCKISIPVEKQRIEINRYQFEIKEASKDSITMLYLGPRKKAK